MTRRPWALLALLVPLVGCVAPASVETASAPEAPPGAAPEAAAWPALEDARIRPGVSITRLGPAPVGGCTANFVFASPDNATLYLGTAAHCVTQERVGDDVWIAGETAKGRLVYSSWKTMEEQGEADASALAYNDFALLEIKPQDRALVHPAVLGFGGPTALADSSRVGVGDGVRAYGGSFARMGQEAVSRLEGEVVLRPDPWTSRVKLVTPGVPADSGSGVMLDDGAALGVLVTLSLDPREDPPSNGVTSLDLALAYARERAGVDVALVPWPLLR